MVFSSKLDFEAIQAETEAEFKDEVRDTVNAVEILLGNVDSSAEDPDEALVTLRRIAMQLYTRSLAVDLPFLRLVVHRMSEYLGKVEMLAAKEIADLRLFIDEMSALLDADETVDAAQLVRRLPSAVPDMDFGDLEKKDIEVLALVPERVVSRILDEELSSCGYRVTQTRSPFDAIEVAVRTRPNLVVSAMELEGMSGVDLACALEAIALTQGVPFVLLTSYARDHAALKRLPEKVAIVRKGKNFSDDMAEAIEALGIS